MARRLTCFCCCISLFFFPDSLECHNSCDGRLAVPLLLTVISNARTGFNTNLINPSLEFVFSDVFRINDMMVLVCWRSGMTSVCNLQFCFTVNLWYRISFEVTFIVETTSDCKSIVLVNSCHPIPRFWCIGHYFTLYSLRPRI